MLVIKSDEFSSLCVRDLNMDIVSDDTKVALLINSEIDSFCEEGEISSGVYTIAELKEGAEIDCTGGSYENIADMIIGFNKEISNFKLEPKHFNSIGMIGGSGLSKDEIIARIGIMRAKHNEQVQSILTARGL